MLVNSHSLEHIPNELKRLTSLDIQIISQVLPFMKVFALHTGAQHKLSGQVVLVPADLSKVTTKLPRNTASAQIITLALKRRLSDKHPYNQQPIRPSYVNEAVSYFKAHSPLYSQVQVNPNWQKDSADSNSHLWSAVNSTNTGNSEGNINLCEINDNIEDNTTTSQCEPYQEDNRNKDDVTDSEDEVDCDNPIEIQEELQTKSSLSAVTCVRPVNGPEVQ